ncbi:hypothetical protein E05_38130 [Plautia stali symbiont]|nr:hypothetical protein E05_38130 [Plautia stali symbiont]
MQNAFCPLGSYDPLDTLFSGVLSLQLGAAFDEASQLICQPDAFRHNDMVIFPHADTASWPLRQRYRPKQGVRYGEETDDAR